MKVELDDLQIGVSPLTGEVFVGILDKKNPSMWKHKKNVSNGFVVCVIEKYKGNPEKYSNDDGKTYLKVSVEEEK